MGPLTVNARREVEHQTALAPPVDQELAGVGAMAVHSRGAVARAPADQGAVRQERVTGGASLGRDLLHAAIR